jgi:hypothetical protein
MSDIYQRIMGEVDYDNAKKSMELKQAGKSYTPDVYGKVQADIDQDNTTRAENVDRWKYTVPVTDLEYKVLNQAFENSSDPEADRYRYAAAMTFAKEYNAPLDWAIQNLVRVPAGREVHAQPLMADRHHRQLRGRGHGRGDSQALPAVQDRPPRREGHEGTRHPDSRP